MHEAPLANIDADVADATTAPVEQQDVTGFEMVARDFLRMHAADFVRGSGYGDASHGAEHVVDQAAAIEAARRRVAAVPIWRADQTDGTEKNIVRIGVRDGCILWRRWLHVVPVAGSKLHHHESDDQATAEITNQAHGG